MDSSEAWCLEGVKEIKMKRVLMGVCLALALATVIVHEKKAKQEKEVAMEEHVMEEVVVKANKLD